MKKIIFSILISINLFAINLHQATSANTEQEQKLSFKQMESFYKKSKKAEHKLALAVLYTFGSKEKDEEGYEVQPNYIQAVKYYKEAYKKGQTDAMTIMYGYLIQDENKEFREAVDPKLEKTEKGLIKEVKNKNLASYSLLGNLYIQTDRPNEALKVLHKGDIEVNDATSQFGLALIYYKGVTNCQGDYITKPGESSTALYFLNKACLNENKTEDLEKICTNPQFIKIEQKDISLEAESVEEKPFY
jgi:TPR repeat protein